MKLFLFLWALLISSGLLCQKKGTIWVEKKQTKEIYTVQFSGAESGPLILKDYLIDKCLLNNLGVITTFEVIVEDRTGNWRLLKNKGGCMTAANYQILEQLSSGSNIEFINIMGLNDAGNNIIFPGMKFVIKK